MSIVTITSNVRADETPTEHPPCCGHAPVKLTWKRKPFVGLSCTNTACPNWDGVLGYSEKDALDRWNQVRREAA